jgi:aspartyl-tRNA(Asn)/glutamyl-tRNA(Gln) amidotransferase subunit A
MAAGREAELSPSVQNLLKRQWTADEFIAGIVGRKRIVSAMTALMAKYDLVLTPTVPLLPFPVDRDGPGTIDGAAVADDAWSPACFPANLTGQPAASVPAGWTTDGLPVGLQIIGRHLADRAVVAAAAAYEASRPAPPLPPIHV